MSDNDSVLPDCIVESSLEGEMLDSSEALLGPSLDGGLTSDERLQADKNTARQRRSKLQGMASKFGLLEEEVRMLAAAGLMMPDPFEAMMISDPERRVDAVQDHSRMRVQYTNFMIPPRDVEAYIDGSRSIKIDSKPFIKNDRSLGDLMVAVRGATKILDGIGAAYAEQHAFLRELLRLVVERQQMGRVMRSTPPKYLIDFARMLESLGCKRNHLRSVDGKLVRMIREQIGLTDEAAGRSVDSDADRFRSWLAEEEELAVTDDEKDEDPDEFDRLSKIAAQALMVGDMNAARLAFANLEEFDASLEGEFGTAGVGQTVENSNEDAAEDAAENMTDDAVEASDDNDENFADAALSKTGSTSPLVPDTVTGDDDATDNKADRALTAEADGGVRLVTDREMVSVLIDGSPPPSSSPIVLAIPPLVEPPIAASITAPPPSPPTPPPPLPASDQSEPSEPLRYLTGWGISVPTRIDHERVTGIGRLPGADAFGGVVSTASATPEVVPMWRREDRKPSTGDRLTLDDWYRFEVPFGPYALVHMPRKFPDYVPVSDEMFPPFMDLERYGVAAGSSPVDMRALKIAATGRGAMDVAVRAVRSVLIMNYGKDDEDLVRFWLFLLLGRQFMSRIDVLFPHGFFHGVWAPDPAAREIGLGFFRIVRVLDDGNLSARMRTPMFAPFETLRTIPPFVIVPSSIKASVPADEIASDMPGS